jgi:hypothetical protein
VVAFENKKVTIRWFVGLGTGSDPEQMPQEEEIVKRFNASQDRIELVVESVENSQAPDQLKTQVAAGNPPDIIGRSARVASTSSPASFWTWGPICRILTGATLTKTPLTLTGWKARAWWASPLRSIRP